MNNEPKVYKSNNLPAAVNVDQFIEELKTSLKFNQNVKVFFIGYPKINSIENTDIDLLLIIAIENRTKSFLTIPNQDNGSIYFNNLIIPIKFFKKHNERLPKNTYDAYHLLISNELERNLDEDIKEISFKTKKYLERIFNREKFKFINKSGEEEKLSVYPYPIMWILQDKNEWNFTYNNLIYAPKFGFKELEAHLRFAHFDKSISSVYHWSKERDNEEAFLIIDKQINNLISQLEKDNKIGLLTKKKIDRLNKEYQEDLRIYEKYLSEQNKIGNQSDSNEDDNIFELMFGNNEQSKQKLTKLSPRIRADKELHNNLVIISGKAGSGKTTEMLLLMNKCYREAHQDGKSERSTYYLTYNKLLTHDVRFITNKYQNFGSEQSKTAIKTIHKFFFDIVDNITVLAVMTVKRRNELKKIQEERHKHISYIINENKHNLYSLNEATNKEFTYKIENKETLEYYLLMISRIRKMKKLHNDDRIKQESWLQFINDYHQENIGKIEKDLEKSIFLSDYYQVLRYILLAIKAPSQLYDELEIEDLEENEWQNILNKKRSTRNKKSGKFELPDYLISKSRKEGFIELTNRTLGGVRGAGKVLFIDEAQDCHSLERDIFLALWEQKNVVVCTGGQEQLIRHSEECNWKFNGVANKPIHNIISIEKRSKTYRMKPNLVKLCNFIAEKFQVNLDLSAHKTDTDDLGRVIIDFDKQNLKSVIEQFRQSEEINKLSHYESILFLSETFGLETGSKIKDDIYVDDKNNIINSKKSEDKTSNISTLTGIDSEEFFLHHQKSVKNDQDDSEGNDTPTPNTYRSIYYESCRGLEAWSVVCLDLDLFYQRKFTEDIAGKFLSDDLLLTENERREKYAITWVLMALTRPIDSLYIHISGKSIKNIVKDEFTSFDDKSLSKLSDILKEYIELEH